MELIEILSIVGYLIMCLFVAFEASVRKYNYGYAFLFAIFTTPLIAAIFFSHENRD